MRNGTRKYLRITADLILLLSIFYLPFWFTVIFSFVSVLYFKNYYEFIIAYFVIDSIYGTKEPKFFNLEYVLTLLAIIIFLVTSYVKSKMLSSGLGGLRIK